MHLGVKTKPPQNHTHSKRKKESCSISEAKGKAIVCDRMSLNPKAEMPFSCGLVKEKRIFQGRGWLFPRPSFVGFHCFESRRTVFVPECFC